MCHVVSLIRGTNNLIKMQWLFLVHVHFSEDLEIMIVDRALFFYINIGLKEEGIVKAHIAQ